ncbi:DNA-binding protein [Streptomyces sp. DH37]|uniref:DNA-binding protein n=1 Tax=Streptomyces sp. DH37 TaxID=3040122 RepID=UPI002441D3B1|nr:DNA-binding protein [Streptomyces sp. DH37]MDG9705565.1 DNA-binding protein [Streptomyces sp. DH37]
MTTSVPALSTEEVLALPAIVPVWPTVGQAYGISRTTTYELARADALPVPVIRVGRQFRARRVDLLKSLGITDGAGVAAPTPPNENDPIHTSAN